MCLLDSLRSNFHGKRFLVASVVTALGLLLVLRHSFSARQVAVRNSTIPAPLWNLEQATAPDNRFEPGFGHDNYMTVFSFMSRERWRARLHEFDHRKIAFGLFWQERTQSYVGSAAYFENIMLANCQDTCALQPLLERELASATKGSMSFDAVVLDTPFYADVQSVVSSLAVSHRHPDADGCQRFPPQLVLHTRESPMLWGATGDIASLRVFDYFAT